MLLAFYPERNDLNRAPPPLRALGRPKAARLAGGMLRFCRALHDSIRSKSGSWFRRQIPSSQGARHRDHLRPVSEYYLSEATRVPTPVNSVERVAPKVYWDSKVEMNLERKTHDTNTMNNMITEI